MKLSVIIPAYRAHAFIGDALDSIAAQRLLPGASLEVIVVSDDGTDYTAHFTPCRRQAMQCLAAATGGVAAGASAARNVGMRLATGTFISFLDADDVWLPERAATLLPLAAKHGAAVCTMAITSFGAHAQGGETVVSAQGRLTPEEFLQIDGGICPVYRRDCITQVWDEDLDFAEDVLFNHAAVRNADGLYVHPAPLMQYRIRQDSASHQMPRASHRAEKAYVRMLSRLSGTSAQENVVLAACLQRKRRLNAAYLQAWTQNPTLHFEQFVRQTATA
jgi:glycosyltransferase involved in cell wall biosynthesis